MGLAELRSNDHEEEPGEGAVAAAGDEMSGLQDLLSNTSLTEEQPREDQEDEGLGDMQ